MPFNGSGTFTIVNTFVPNTTILSAAVNQNFTDIATGLSDCLTRDGQAGMTAVFKAISGSVSAPSITFNADATSGLYLSASGIPGFVSHSLGILLNSEVFAALSATVQAGGSGYAVGDTITETGGTAISQAVFQVATVSGTAVATVNVVYSGFYTVAPSNPVSQGSTSGAGTGCTLNITFNDPTSSVYRALITTEAGALPWQRLGASSFVSGLMAKSTGLDFMTAVGGANVVAVLGSSFILPPQGILSTVNSISAPIPTTDQSAITRVYWNPYQGAICPIYNGVSFVSTTAGQIFCDLTSGAQVLGGIYDVYKFLNSGTVTLGFSPTWAAGTSGSVTPGVCARGTGTGGTALSVLNGIYVNTVSMTVNNGATTFSVPANQGTYLGSIYIDATAGQINCLMSYGQSRVWGLWNAYNRRPLYLKAGDSSATWTPNNASSFHAVNTNAANALVAFAGLAEETVDFQYYASNGATVTLATQAVVAVGIGFNSVTAASGKVATFTLANVAATYSTSLQADFLSVPWLGINVITALEETQGSNVSTTMSGTEAHMLLSAKYRG